MERLSQIKLPIQGYSSIKITKEETRLVVTNLLNQIKGRNITIRTSCRVERISKKQYGWEVLTEKEKAVFDVIVLAVGKGSRSLVSQIIADNGVSVVDTCFEFGCRIEFAQDENENGVLQRNALSSLIHLYDARVIKELKGVWEREDRHIKENFLQLCQELDPNSHCSIEYFIDGLNQHLTPARHSLSAVKSKSGIKYLLQQFLENNAFLSNFIEESNRHGDAGVQIVSNIKAVWDKDINNKLQALIPKAFELDTWYESERSLFINLIVVLFKEKKKDYIFDLIKQIPRSEKLKKNLFCFLNLFSILLDKVQVNRFIKELSKINNGKWLAFRTLEQIKYSNSQFSEEIYEEGRKYFQDEYTETEKRLHEQKQKPSSELRIYHDFKFKLEPEPGKYSSDVFNFFISNKEQLKSYLTQSDRQRLKSLVEGSILDRFDPGKQKLTITAKDGSRTTYTTHPFVHIFGDVIKVSKELNINIKQKYRQKIINYIPFAYHDDQETIFNLIKDIKSKEMKPVLQIYKKRNSDLWRFIPSSLIEASKKYNLIEAIPILQEFVLQKDFNICDRSDALKTSEFLSLDPKFLKRIFNIYKKSKDSEKHLADIANELLIDIHSENKAVDWRLKQILKRAFKFTREEGVHSVSKEESELQVKAFASPLMRLKDINYKEQFLELLGNSFKLLKADSQYYSYSQYMWGIVRAYFENLKEQKSYEPIKKLEDYVSKHATEEGVNWFSYTIKELKRKYIQFIGKPSNIAECIRKYNKLKSEQYLDITRSENLFEEIKEVINSDLKKWACSDGIKLLQDKDETEIQKILKINLENCLLRRGFRPNEITIIREPQLASDKRTDFIISYGFVGPIIIETKLSSSEDLKGKLENKASYQSMKHYMKGYNAHFGILLVLKNKTTYESSNKWSEHLLKIANAYHKIPNIEVLGVDIFKN
jgi:hypothetical protein